LRPQEDRKAERKRMMEEKNKSIIPLTSITKVLKNTHIYPLVGNLYDRSLKNVCVKVEVPAQHHVSWRKDRTNHWGQNPFLKCKKGTVMQLQEGPQSWASGFFTLTFDKLMFYSYTASGEQNTKQRSFLPLDNIIDTVYTSQTKKNVIVDIRTSKTTWRISGKKRDAEKLVESVTQAKLNITPQKIEHWDFVAGNQGYYINIVEWNGVVFDVNVAKVTVLKEHPKFGFSVNDDIATRPEFFHQASIYEHDSHEGVLHKLVYPQFRLSGTYAILFQVTYGTYLFEIEYTINVEVRGGKYPKKRDSSGSMGSRGSSPRSPAPKLDNTITPRSPVPKLDNTITLVQPKIEKTITKPYLFTSRTPTVQVTYSVPQFVQILGRQVGCSSYLPYLEAYFKQAVEAFDEKEVTEAAYSHFLDTFSHDLNLACVRLQYFMTKDWFFGILSDPERLLKGQRPGTYLVRCSRSKAGFAVSRVDSKGRLQQHNGIKFYSKIGNETIVWKTTEKVNMYTNFSAFLKTFPSLSYPCQGSPFGQLHESYSSDQMWLD